MISPDNQGDDDEEEELLIHDRTAEVKGLYQMEQVIMAEETEVLLQENTETLTFFLKQEGPIRLAFWDIWSYC